MRLLIILSLYTQEFCPTLEALQDGNPSDLRIVYTNFQWRGVRIGKDDDFYNNST